MLRRGNWLILSLLCRHVAPTIISNAVVAQPEVECSADTIMVAVNTQNAFEGNIFVKGHFNESDCRTGATGKPMGTIKLSFTRCGLSRERSSNPPGIYVSAVVIIMFHPTFITKVDRAYHIRCSYVELSRSVSSQLEVSALPTTDASGGTLVPMLDCKYDILHDGPNGTPVRYAVIGEQVYHKWSCESRRGFCMTVHSCFVDDGQSGKYVIIDADGCAVDKYLLGNLEYPDDLRAGREVHVFRFAERATVAFQCQILISAKEGAVCKRPFCPEPYRGKREHALPSTDPTGVNVDVRSDAFDVYDLEEDPNRFRSAPTVVKEKTCASSQAIVVLCFCTIASCLLVTSAIGLLFFLRKWRLRK